MEIEKIVNWLNWQVFQSSFMRISFCEASAEISNFSVTPDKALSILFYEDFFLRVTGTKQLIAKKKQLSILFYEDFFLRGAIRRHSRSSRS